MTREVEVPVEVTRIVKVTRAVEVPVEVTHIVEVTREVVITATQPQTPPTSTAPVIPTTFIEEGEWWGENGVELRVSGYNLDSTGFLDIDVEIANNTNNNLIFQWDESRNFVLTDNTGFRYGHSGNDSGANANYSPGFNGQLQTRGYQYTSIWLAERAFASEVTDLYFTIKDLAGTSQMTWRIHLK